MNNTFAEYTTSTAFSLNLSKLQCNCLLRIADQESKMDNVYTVSVDTLQALQRRGLIDWNKTKDGLNAGYFITRAGELLAGLLKEAGLTVENTNTLRVLRTIQRGIG